jgi:hypothetical protein
MEDNHVVIEILLSKLIQISINSSNLILLTKLYILKFIYVLIYKGNI